MYIIASDSTPDDDFPEEIYTLRKARPFVPAPHL
jgi:hypothetical protein